MSKWEETLKARLLNVIAQQRYDFASEKNSVQYKFCNACYRACERGGARGLAEFLTHMQEGELTFRDVEYIRGIDRRSTLLRLAGFTTLAVGGFFGPKMLYSKGEMPETVNDARYFAGLIGLLGDMATGVEYMQAYKAFDEVFAAYVHSPELERDMNLLLSHMRLHHSYLMPPGMSY